MERDRFRYFRIEARELLEQLGQGVLTLERSTPSPELVGRLLRLAHTLKGAARVVKRQDLADQAHAVEDVLDAFRTLAAPVPRDRIDHLLQLLDDMEGRVATLPASTGVTIGPGEKESEDLFRAFRPEMQEMDALLNAMAEVHGRVAALRPIVSRAERARHLADVVIAQFASPALSDVESMDSAASLRIRSLADELRATIGTLEQDLLARVDQLSREVRETRGAAERLRLVPAGALFTLLSRTTRDTAQALGKRVVFEGRGGDVRLDASVLSLVQGALLQVVRNAVAHGIEPPAQRTAAGKAPDGRVTLDVRRRGSSIVFSCRDDGQGIDLEAIRRVAHLKGLSPAVADLSRPEEVVALLLKGGITTSSTPTHVSGRGVGLDMVRDVAERLGGEVVVRTDAQEGTTLEIVVPLTLTSLEGLVVEALGVTAVIPIHAVRENLRVTPEAIVRTAQGYSIMFKGREIPLGSLGRALARDTSPTPTVGPFTALVVQGHAAIAAFSVDRVVGIESVVFRPLPNLAPAASFVVGASLDVDGTPHLVIDPDALVAEVGSTLHSTDEPEAPRQTVLVIDDSLTTRMLEQSILESAGYDVDLAVSGEEALQKARAKRYALFLVDVEMPGMDGFAFIEQVRAEPALRDIPSILVTSRSAPEDQRRGLEVGAQVYIVKSEFDQGLLLEQMRRLVT